MQNTLLPSHFFWGSRSPTGVNWLPGAAVTSPCQLTPDDGLAVGPYFPEGIAALLKCARSLKPFCISSPIPPCRKPRCQQSFRKNMPVFKSAAVKGEGKLSSLSCFRRGTSLPHGGKSLAGHIPQLQWDVSVCPAKWCPIAISPKAIHNVLCNYFCGGIKWLGIWDICCKQDTLHGSLYNSAGLRLPETEAGAWDCFSDLAKGKGGAKKVNPSLLQADIIHPWG